MKRSATTPGKQESENLPSRPRVISGDDTGEPDFGEYGMQHGGTHGPAMDDALKRMTRSHPRRDIPRIESMDPPSAPPKE